MIKDDFLAALQNNPDMLLHDFDFQNRRGLLVKINEQTYRSVSFLDRRMLTRNTVGAWFPLKTLCSVAASGPAPPIPHYILHVGYCGSTLISRLLAELPGNLPVREPTALLALAVVRRELGRPESWLSDTQWQRYYDLTTRTLARTYRSGHRAIIKLTSTAGNLLEPMLASGQSVSQLLMLYLRLETLLTIMLRSPDMRETLHADSQKWIADFCRLTARSDIRLAELNDAQQVVIKWLTLMLLFTSASQTNPAQVRLLDFDDFLKNPAGELDSIARHFRLGAGDKSIGELASGPLMQRYSKIPSQAFNPTQRARELNEARQRCADEITAGLHWAEKLCDGISALESVSHYLRNGS